MKKIRGLMTRTFSVTMTTPSVMSIHVMFIRLSLYFGKENLLAGLVESPMLSIRALPVRVVCRWDRYNDTTTDIRLPVGRLGKTMFCLRTGYLKAPNPFEVQNIGPWMKKRD